MSQDTACSVRLAPTKCDEAVQSYATRDIMGQFVLSWLPRLMLLREGSRNNRPHTRLPLRAHAATASALICPASRRPPSAMVLERRKTIVVEACAVGHAPPYLPAPPPALPLGFTAANVQPRACKRIEEAAIGGMPAACLPERRQRPDYTTETRMTSAHMNEMHEFSSLPSMNAFRVEYSKRC